jgi:acid stress-induced BolA-like protein IbaG/YrbA
MLNPAELAQRLRAALPGAHVEINDTTGTGDHFQAVVVSPSFEGKSMIEQHQLVYAVFGTELKSGALHALQLKTFTPAQWERRQGGGR